MRKYLLLSSTLACLAWAPLSASAMPIPAAPDIGPGSDVLIEKAWHSGLPHRRVVGDRVYGGRCPPQGCPLSSQRDITPDPVTGKYRYYAAPPSAGYGPGTYAAPRRRSYDYYPY